MISGTDRSSPAAPLCSITALTKDQAVSCTSAPVHLPGTALLLVRISAASLCSADDAIYPGDL